jgi:alkanesulfonate monooxygenase SsuD/methylene tetrahydromethanopterin reductase-like flavin-dependent oxidoreductase (luciferase family)
LATAAPVTTRLRLSTGVLLAGLCDPVIAAKGIATLDWLSGGRVGLGVGYGWNREELATHDVPLEAAPEVLVDKLGLMCEPWTADAGHYEGSHARVEPSWSWPKPRQQPRPPIHFGGRAHARLFCHAARLGDGWLPIESYGSVPPHLGRLRDAFAAIGRDPAEAIVSVFSAAGDPATVDRYAAAGIARVVVSLPPADRDTVWRALDRHSHRLADLLSQNEEIQS